MDGVDRLIEWMDGVDRANLARQKALLMKLNKAELAVLAKHFEISNSLMCWCLEPHDYKFGGKEELCEELAERMLF